MIEIFAVRNVRVDLANCRKCVTRDIYISRVSTIMIESRAKNCTVNRPLDRSEGD